MIQIPPADAPDFRMRSTDAVSRKIFPSSQPGPAMAFSLAVRQLYLRDQHQGGWSYRPGEKMMRRIPRGSDR